MKHKAYMKNQGLIWEVVVIIIALVILKFAFDFDIIEQISGFQLKNHSLTFDNEIFETSYRKNKNVIYCQNIDINIEENATKK